MKPIIRIFSLFVILTFLLMASKLVFTLYVGGYSAGDTVAVMWHGLGMDMAVSGYFSALMGLYSLLLVWLDNIVVRNIARLLLCMTGVLLSLCIVANAGLYEYWKFPLDSTPLFYFVSSPSAAMASLPAEMWVLAGLTVAILTWIFYKSTVFAYFTLPAIIVRRDWSKVWCTCTALLATGLLFIPIRGGFTVSTMNMSRAYFSDDNRLNHAAVNPMFSLIHSLLQQRDFGSQFRFMDDTEARAIVDELYASALPSDSAACGKASHSVASLPFLPDIQLIILESFSSHLMPSLGGEPVALRLDSIASGGLLFSDIYASSFRTDRALMALLCGFPAQPTTSLMKYTGKIEKLPSICRSLKEAGYETAYIYGGDINFTNMNSLLMSNGFATVIKDKDFPLSRRLSKWGVHDDALFEKALEYAGGASTTSAPRFTVIQTSSSHEPFEVPHRGRFADPRMNAFEFTDSLLGKYVEGLKRLPRYDRTLIVIVPDHYGAWPEVEDHSERHRVPVILAGGAAAHIGADSVMLARTGSQTDIAATLLALAGVDHSQFIFSNNLLDPCRKPFAFFSEPKWIALKTDKGYEEINVDTGSARSGADASLSRMLKAYVQTLYNVIDSL